MTWFLLYILLWLAFRMLLALGRPEDYRAEAMFRAKAHDHERWKP